MHNIVEIDSTAIEPVPSYGPCAEGHRPFVAAMAEVGEELVAILNVENLILLPQELAEIGAVEHEAEEVEAVPAPERIFCPQATPEDRAIFRERARSLRHRQVEGAQDASAPRDLAVVKLNDEYFGIELKLVREIVAVGEITVIPCCPDFVAGAINWHGEVMALIDIGSALDIAPLEYNGQLQAVVVRSGDVQVGILVEAVLDVLPLGEHATVPVSGETFVRGTLPYKDRMLGVLDLEGMLGSEHFVVDEEAKG